MTKDFSKPASHEDQEINEALLDAVVGGLGAPRRRRKTR